MTTTNEQLVAKLREEIARLELVVSVLEGELHAVRRELYR
jgi:hypothetical protein